MKRTNRVLSAMLAAAMVLSAGVQGVKADGAKWTETETADGWMLVTNEGGKTLGYSKTSGVKLLEVDGFAFKDLDKDGELDVYEDWRESYETRARDLVNQMSGEEIAPYLTHGGLGTFTTNRDVLRSDKNTGYDYILGGGRGGVTRNTGTTAKDAVDHAKWVNLVQELCEELDYGIPALVSIDPNDQAGLVQGLSLASTMDTELAINVGKAYSEQYRAMGVNALLGPQIDLMGSPTMERGFETYGEDPALSRDITEAFVSGMQSTWDGDTDLGWGGDSVLTIMKHYSGAGASEGGRDDHTASGKYSVFPNNNYEAHLIAFHDGAFNLTHSSTKSAGGVMMNYSANYSEDGSLGDMVGGAFCQWKYDTLFGSGWTGFIISDWGPLSGGGGSWGMQDYTDAERIMFAIELGMTQMGGYSNLDNMQEAYKLLVEELGEDEALELMRTCAYKNVIASMRLGLFDNPYCSTEKVMETNCTAESLAYGVETQEKAMVLLKNDGTIKDNTASEEKQTVYVPAQFTAGATNARSGKYTPASAKPGMSLAALEKYYNVITDTIGEPTGTAPDGTAELQPSDIVAPSAEELAKVDLVVVAMTGPYTASTVDANYDESDDEEYGMYTAPSLQYKPYTAAGARNPSIGGEVKIVTFSDGYTMQTSSRKQNLSYWNKTAGNDANISHLEKLEAVKAMNLEAPIVVVMSANRSGAMVWSEVEPLADVVFYRYGSVSDDAAVELIAGKVEPSALLCQQQPASMQAVEKEFEDVSRDLECYVDANGNTYDFAYGLNWSGVINDERVATYSAAPLTHVENMQFHYAQ